MIWQGWTADCLPVLLLLQRSAVSIPHMTSRVVYVSRRNFPTLQPGLSSMPNASHHVCHLQRGDICRNTLPRLRGCQRPWLPVCCGSLCHIGHACGSRLLGQGLGFKRKHPTQADKAYETVAAAAAEASCHISCSHTLNAQSMTQCPFSCYLQAQLL